MVTIYVRFQVPQGWTYAAYSVADEPGESHRTLLPTALELVSKVIEGFDDTDRDSLDTHRDAITAALTARYPECRVEFVEVPRAPH